MSSLLNALAPVRCAGCGQWDAHLCAVCTGRLLALPAPSRQAGVQAAFEYREPVNRIIAAAKYGDHRTALRHLAELAAPRLGPLETLLPVPLGSRRRRGRGFNQAELIARVWSDYSGTPLARGCLVRRRETSPQVGRHRDEREANIAGAFLVVGAVPSAVTLVDDVHTTGATLHAATVALRAAGVETVRAAVLARTI